MEEIFIVIRAGGTGTRLWPLSTSALPKQFVPVFSSRTMLQETVARVAPFGYEHIFVTTNQQYLELTHTQVPEIFSAHIFAELLKRNTGPGIAYEVASLVAAGISLDAVVATIPADDFIERPELFRASLGIIAAQVRAHPESIVMPVVTPEQIDPGYSYVRADFSAGTTGPLTDWVEKPDRDTCAQMIETGSWYAHTGMYVWRLGTVVHLFEMHAPEVWRAVCDMQKKIAAGDFENARVIAAQLPIISIESLLTKQVSARVAYMADTWGWSDVGKWMVLKNVLAHDEADNVVSRAHAEFVDAHRNVVYGDGEKTIVCVGVDDLIVVETEAYVLVCRENLAHHVTALAERFNKA
jgi:mannose-1-phosphate guanylyltransferase